MNTWQTVNEIEDAKRGHLAAGGNALLLAMLASAEGVGLFRAGATLSAAFPGSLPRQAACAYSGANLLCLWHATAL
jgi:hypothetical protein